MFWLFAFTLCVWVMARGERRYIVCNIHLIVMWECSDRANVARLKSAANAWETVDIMLLTGKSPVESLIFIMELGPFFTCSLRFRPSNRTQSLYWNTICSPTPLLERLSIFDVGYRLQNRRYRSIFLPNRQKWRRVCMYMCNLIMDL